MQEASTLQELPSSASPVVSDAKHAPGKLVKQEDSKGDSPVPAAPGISAEGLERLIAMGRPQGESACMWPKCVIEMSGTDAAVSVTPSC